MLYQVFLGQPMYDEYLYNCSGTSPYTTRKFAVGAIYFGIGVISQFVYILVLATLYRIKSLFNLPCYKIMFFLGIADILCLTFCCVVFGLWHMSCLYVLLLAFDRVCELIAPIKCAFLFKGSYLKMLLSLPYFYFIYFTFFTKPTFFQPSISAFLLNPNSEITKNYPASYYTVEAYVFNNFFVMIFIGFSYCIICGKLFSQSWKSTVKQTSALVKRVTYQCLTVCTCHFIGCFLYVYIQYFPMPDFLNYVCHFAWIGNHSLPPFVYLLFNPSLRSEVLSLFFPKKFREISDLGTVNSLVVRPITVSAY
ncbi:unnamed protein product [Caenorhabditis angaria]|uniref:Uncharacterized protein n=1 Tax=Caenorhabditis angaria TaxID=860376 RepID=A0A9P1N4N3_9PELO|nr:unnamed protein product [Caenorhabditis angaria]